MKAHELAKVLLAGPNVPVVINGWGSDEGFTFEVTEASPLGQCSYSGARDTKRTRRNDLGYPTPRECLSLYHCRPTPYSEKQIREEQAQRRKARRLKKRNPALYALTHPTITPLTPDMLVKMCECEEAAKLKLAKL
jgi:hypothetical protein